MKLSDEMRRLTQLFQATHDLRTETLTGIRANTAEQLQQQREALAQTTAEAAQQRADFRDGLQKDVADLRQDAAEFLQQADASLSAGAAEAAQARAEYRSDLRQTVGALCSDAQLELRDQGAARQAEAAEQAEARASYMRDKRNETAAFLAAAGNGLQAVAMSGAQSRAGFLQSVQLDVQGLRAETVGFLNEADTARQAEAMQSAGQRVEFIQTVRADVHQLRQGVAEQRQEIVAARRALHADLNESRQVWRSYNMLTQTRKGRKPAMPTLSKPAPAPVVAAVQPAVMAQPVGAEPLTKIKGIGQATEKLLHDEGIHTYARLAAANPDQLRSLLGERGRLVKVEEWIEQAQKLAGSA